MPVWGEIPSESSAQCRARLPQARGVPAQPRPAPGCSRAGGLCLSGSGSAAPSPQKGDTRCPSAPRLHRPSRGREGVPGCSTRDHGLARVVRTLRSRPRLPSPGEPGKGPEILRLASWGGTEGLWFNLPSLQGRAVQQAWGLL